METSAAQAKSHNDYREASCRSFITAAIPWDIGHRIRMAGYGIGLFLWLASRSTGRLWGDPEQVARRLEVSIHLNCLRLPLDPPTNGTERRYFGTIRRFLCRFRIPLTRGALNSEANAHTSYLLNTVAPTSRANAPLPYSREPACERLLRVQNCKSVPLTAICCHRHGHLESAAVGSLRRRGCCVHDE